MTNNIHQFLKDQADEISASVEGLTLIDLLNRNAEEYGNFPALNTPVNSDYTSWDSLSWSETRDLVHRVAAGLIAIGVEPKDTGFIMSNNCLQHNVADLAILHTGAVPSTLYRQLKSGQVEYVANLMEAKIAFVGDAELFAEVDEAKKSCPNLKYVILFNDSEQYKNIDYVLSWDDLIQKGDELISQEREKLDRAIETVTPESLACLIFTSGTTGKPKGVMISHHNVIWTIESLFSQMITASNNPRIVSYLPMAHIAARAGDHYQALYRVGQIFPVPVLEDLAKALPTIKPSVLLAVPRVWEKVKAGLMAKINESDKKDLALKAIDNGIKKVEYEQKGENPPFGVKLKDAVFSKLVFSKFKDGLGIADTEYFVTAAAPMNPEVHKWFHAIGIDITEIYGMTEDTGPCTVGIPKNALKSFGKKLKSAGVAMPDILNPIGKVGLPIAGTEVRVEEDGELWMKGNHVTKGYYKDEEQTAESFDSDGWLHTGDLAEIDESGFVKIIGRKKEIIITSAGKNIAPVEVEELIKPHVLIGQACVVGDGKKYLTALVVLDSDGGAEKWAADNGLPYSLKQLSQNKAVLDAIQQQIDEANSKVAQVQQVKKFVILENEWTDTSGELTPTLKLKRNVINEKYTKEIESMYMDDE